MNKLSSAVKSCESTEMWLCCLLRHAIGCSPDGRVIDLGVKDILDLQK